MTTTIRIIMAALLALGLVLPAAAQTRASRSDYSVSSGRTSKTPRNYQKWVNQSQSLYGYRLSPFIVMPVQQAAPVVLGPTRRYSDGEYSELVNRILEARADSPVSQRDTSRSVVVEAPGSGAVKRYEPVDVRVMDVLDRGSLLADTGEEIKLRGVRMPTQRDPNSALAHYSRDGVRTLRQLTYNVPLRVTFGNPLRNRLGMLLGTATLEDGTDLAVQMLEQGYGWLDDEDAVDAARLAELRRAETVARTARIGVWSVR